MPTVRAIIERLLPAGSNPGTTSPKPSWRVFPVWPPDAFAAAATVVWQAGLYCRPCFTGATGDSLLTPECVVFGRDVARRWRSNALTDKDKQALQKLWLTLCNTRTGDVTDAESGTCPEWWKAALTLMITADEASKGVGFANPRSKSAVAQRVVAQHQRFLLEPKGYAATPDPRKLPYLPNSLCVMVPPGEACVQPKSRTPQIGCTLRSLTHHLALLPGLGEVSTSWIFGDEIKVIAGALGAGAVDPALPPLNLLVVPFPYRIADRWFQPGAQVQEALIRRIATDLWERDGRPEGRQDAHWLEATKMVDAQGYFFGLHQGWLHALGRKVTAEEICDFLKGLMDEVRGQNRQVNGIILPELALDESLALEAADILSDEEELELFICGIHSPPAGPGQLPRNQVLTCRYLTGDDAKRRVLARMQSKHHRWRVDRGQVMWNLLEDVLSPDKMWWEGINVEARTCGFYVFRHGASLATLICEDLARIDPVQNVIRAVGPNLVIALLMDGPQLERRWPGRYATVLADDPGSSVLTLSSLGLMRRLALRADTEARQIALWKEAGGTAHELTLPPDSHALLLPLTFKEEENFSLDGRSDRKTSVGIALDRNRVRAIRYRGQPLGWLDLG